MPKPGVVAILTKELNQPRGEVTAGSWARRLVRALDSAGYQIVKKPAHE